MNKPTYIVLIIVSMLTFFTGCSGSKSKDSGITLTILTVESVREREAFARILRAYKRVRPEVKFNMIYAGGNFYDKAMTMLAGGETTDLLWLGEGFPAFAEKGMLLDISPYLKKNNINTADYYPAAVDRYRYVDKLYTIPYGLSLQFFLYNKNMFQEAGLAAPAAGWSYKDMLTAARKLTARSGSTAGVKYDIFGIFNVHWQTLIHSFGGKIIDDAAKTCLINSSESLAALEFYHDLFNKHRVMATDSARESIGTGGDVQLFLMNRSAMGMEYTWSMGTLAENKTVSWDICENPVEKKPAHWMSTEALVINSKSKQPDEAAKFLMFTISESALKMRSASVPSLISLNKSTEGHKNKTYNWKCFDPIVQSAFMSPRTVKFTEFSSQLNNMITEIRDSKKGFDRGIIQQYLPRLNAILRE